MEMLFKKDGGVEERRMEVGLRREGWRAEKVEGKEGGGMEERGMEGRRRGNERRGGWRQEFCLFLLIREAGSVMMPGGSGRASSCVRSNYWVCISVWHTHIYGHARTHTVMEGGDWVNY